jgi:hypothetical protein
MNKPGMSFGPWSSALDAANIAPLSRFWKRRLAFLAQGANGKPGISRRARILLIVVGVVAIALPTLERIAATNATAQDAPKQVARDPATDPFAPGGLAPPGSAAPPAMIEAPKRQLVEYLPRPTPHELRLQEALKEPIALDFDQQPFSDVMEYIQSYHSNMGPGKEIEIKIDRKALEDAGMAIDLPITVQTESRIRLESALRLLLSQHDLAFVVVDDVLKITTEEAAARTMLVRTYPVGDLVAPDNDFDSLAETLVTTIDPQSWSEAGGEGSISVVAAARSLVVRQNYENHSRILDLLRTLREARSVAGQQDAAGAIPGIRGAAGGFGGGLPGAGFGGFGVPGAGGGGFSGGVGNPPGFGGALPPAERPHPPQNLAPAESAPPPADAPAPRSPGPPKQN